MKKLRLGIIGVGKMGRFHFKNIVSGACPSWEVTAYSGRDPVKRELCFTSQEDTVRPETEYQEYAADSIDGRIVILNNFADAILEGAPLIAPGESGLDSLNISNAAYLSTWTDDWVDIPVDGELFEKYLAERCKKEKAENDSVVVSEAAEELCKKWKL